MALSHSKRKSDQFVDDASESDSVPASKRNKTPSQTTTKAQVDGDGNPYWEISKARRVTISEFKGKQLVHIREYYQKDNEWLPGKKGISMTMEQYSALIKLLPQIEAVLGQKGSNVPRPDYGDGQGLAVGRKGQRQESEDEKSTVRKSNIEATSDEEEQE